MTSFSGHCSVQVALNGAKVGFEITDFIVNKPNISGVGKDQAGAFFVQTPTGGCLPGVYNGKPAASHLKWIKHSKHVDYVFEGPTALADSILTQTGLIYDYKFPSISKGTFIMRSVPVKSQQQLEEEWSKPYDLFISAASEVNDFARGLQIELEKSGYRVFLENPASPVNNNREHSILKESSNFLVIMSDSVFADVECSKEIEAAIAAGKKIFHVTYSGSSWGGASFPPESLIPEKLRPAFDTRKSMKHELNQFDELANRIKEKIGAGTGKAW